MKPLLDKKGTIKEAFLIKCRGGSEPATPCSQSSMINLK
tara:strand:+ start:383 stop:499 length:117 start_codon:yes stop_codon:yes gene_type:complete